MSAVPNALAILCLAAIAGGLLGCAGDPSGQAPQATFEALPPRAEEVDGLSPVEAGLLRLTRLASYHADVVVETPGGDRVEGGFDFVAPDRYRLKLAGGVPLEVITIGSASYVKTGGSWQQAEPTFLPFSVDEILSQAAAAARGQAEPAGTGASNGTACDGFSTTAGGVQRATFCIAPDGPVTRFGYRDGATTVTVVFGNFNGKIEIGAPK